MILKQVKLSRKIDEKIRSAIEKLPSVRLCKKRTDRWKKKYEKLRRIAELYGY